MLYQPVQIETEPRSRVKPATHPIKKDFLSLVYNVYYSVFACLISK